VLAGELARSHPGAAASLTEGLEETLTLQRLGVDGQLWKTLSSTNPIESMIGICRATSRNVKRWQNGDMCLRWTAAGMLEAQTQFRPPRLAPVLRGRRRSSRLSDDERVVALDPAVRGEDEEVEPDCEHLAVLGDRLPVELDDVAESLGVVAPPEAEPLGADPVLVSARRPSLDLLVSLCVRITRWP
jgi:hypothetical protein